MATDVPHFTRDYTSLGAYVPFSQEMHVSRIFLPLRGPGDRFGEVSWKSLAQRAGREVTAETLLWDLVSRQEADALHVSGYALDGFIDQLLAVVKSSISIHESFIFALWVGYSENNHAERGPELSAPNIGPWPREEFAIQIEPLTTLKQYEVHRHALPTYIWSQDHSFILGCPMYSDSIFLTSN